MVATVTFGLWAVWVAWRVAYPKRRLLYAMPVATRLLNAERDVRQGLEVRRGDQILSDPYVLEVTLVNQGRRDIPSSAFDQGRPLTLDVGVPVLDVLKTTSSPGHGLPSVTVEGTALKIGPDLISRRQKISFSLLVDGPDPKLRCPPPHPIDIDVREGEPATAATKMDLTFRMAMGGLLVAQAAALWNLPGAWVTVAVVVVAVVVVTAVIAKRFF